jgi:hypothetical protein
MALIDADTAQAYRAAWEAWIKQVEHIHRVFLEGEQIGPAQIKGLLNREARAKGTYDAARRRLLGIDDALTEPPAGGGNPFR